MREVLAAAAAGRTHLANDFVDLDVAFVVAELAVHAQHRLEPEVLAHGEHADERVVLLDVAGQRRHGAAVADQRSVHSQRPVDRHPLQVALVQHVQQRRLAGTTAHRQVEAMIFPKLYQPEKSQPEQRRFFLFSSVAVGLFLKWAYCCSINRTYLNPLRSVRSNQIRNESVPPRIIRNDTIFFS